MKTEFEIASVIANYVTSNEGVTDFPVTLKQIADEVDTLRMRTISTLDEKGLIKRPFFNYTQTIDFDGSTPARTIKKDLSTNCRYIDVPRLYFMRNGKPAISYIGAFNGSQTYRVVSGLQGEVHKADRWIGNLPTVVILQRQDVDGYRLEFRNASPNKGKLIGIFEDPSDLEQYGYKGTRLTSSEGGSLYPLPSGEIDIIIGKTVESYLRTLYRQVLQGNQNVDAPKQTKEPT